MTHERIEAVTAWSRSENGSAAGVKRTFTHSRFGFLGNNYSGMLDMYSDYTMLQAELGLHLELLEMCDLDRFIQTATEDENC